MKFSNRFVEQTHPLVDNSAFAQFFETTHLNTYRYVMALGRGDAKQAEDITAEAYLHAWKQRQSFTGGPDAALGWVLTIARRILIDEYRSKTAHPVQTQLQDDLADDDPNTESVVLTREMEEQVIGALQRIPEDQREMVVLRYVLGWRVNQIAAHLNLPENTVSVSIHRALHRLQDDLALQGAANERAE
ncbi:RNA polymerase sigma factor, sigma-70 family [Longilinea arvoryzae]|uniref:RNA polymerase sigma factor, sigma-70 family n=1 Tax=Longilinea arvoryzae TaxID=360412 RepID=A0A0S7BFE5_9CHLR|nr:sigma-70 family RNA polymerase sigma factor [Longilinea arvoryzae]GAP13728.1 RNA polymerase sigma factor, sigma-70 family [Longilinea arvoryzae]